MIAKRITQKGRTLFLKKRSILLFILPSLIFLIAWVTQSVPSINYVKIEVLAEYPHDTKAYTQGLVWHDGKVYESTGKYGKSELREIELGSGKIIKRHPLENHYFGEGLASTDTRLVQLTWTRNVAFVYDQKTFEPLARFSYRGQGWGLCFSEGLFYMSNGSDELTIREPDHFLVVDRKKVTKNGKPVFRLNELECANGQVWANIWNSDQIVSIDPSNGKVTAIVDASSLHPHRDGTAEDVLNGIAYIPERQTFLLTGKNWPKLFEVRFDGYP